MSIGIWLKRLRNYQHVKYFQNYNSAPSHCFLSFYVATSFAKLYVSLISAC